MFHIVLKTHETWLICGGRDFTDRATFEDAMSRFVEMWGCPNRIVHGDATGADALAGGWGKRMGIEVIAVPADWQEHGKAAGPIRNEQMLTYAPKRVIAFPGGKGTEDMVKRAKKLLLCDVIEVALREPTVTPTNKSET